METRGRHIAHLFRETARGKTLGRILVNCAVEGTHVAGRIADFGAGKKRASHHRFLFAEPGTAITSVSIDPASLPDAVADLTKGAPFLDRSVDVVLCFNLLEHVPDPARVLAEATRILAEGGRILGSVPFLHPIHGDPHDFFRYTDEALIRLLGSAGFKDIAVRPLGWGPFAAAYTQIEAVLPRVARFVVLPCVALCDAVLARARPAIACRAPLAYIFSAHT